MSVLYPFINSAYAYNNGGVWGQHMYFGTGYGFMGGMFMFVLWILVIGAVIYLVMQHSAGSCGSTMRSKNSALDILKERYAKGEIDKAEFEDKKKDII